MGSFIAAIVAAVYGLFKVFGEKWLEARFEQRLDELRHEQQKEIEKYRLKINTLFDRTTKLHQREFEILPEAWAKLNDAYWETRGLISPFQEYPDLARMSAEQFIDFTDKCSLAPWEKDELKKHTGEDRNTYFIKHIYWSRLTAITEKVASAEIYILKNGIFLPADIKAKFTTLSDMVVNALSEHKFYKQHEYIRPAKRENQQDLQQRGQELLKDLEMEVSGRLWESLEPTPAS